MSDWCTAQIGEITNRIQTGSTPSTSHPEYFNGDVNWFTPSDIGDQIYLTRSERTISQLGLKEGKGKLFEAGTLLITCIGNIGRVGIIKEPSSANQQITALKLKDFIFENYAYYWFIKNQSFLEKNANQAIVPILNNDRLSNIPFQFPSFLEQQRIAAILEKADRLRRLRRYALELGETFLQSVFLEMFGDPAVNPHNWERGYIGDIVKMSQYGTSNKSNQEGKGYPVLGMGNITYGGRINLSSLTYVEISQKEFDDLKLEQGDILFNRTNSTELVGKTAYWKYPLNAVLASYLVKLKLTPNVLSEFFTCLLNTPYFKQMFRERCKKAIGQSNISPTLLKEFPMIIPPLEVQHKFAGITKQIDNLMRRQSESLRQAEHLFQTILYRTFNEQL